MDDLEITHKWHNDQDLYKTLAGNFRFVSIDAEKDWLQQKTKYSHHEINLMICLVENNRPIGLISVRDINWVSRNGQLTGISICEPSSRGKGYGSEALSLMLMHCFKDLVFNRIWAYIISDNQISLKVFKKCGFMVEGHLKQHVYKNGEFKDLVVVGLCANQYDIHSF